MNYPHLLQAFLKFNAALPSSAAVERLFSCAGQILIPRRCKLSDTMFEKLVFLRCLQNQSKWNWWIMKYSLCHSFDCSGGTDEQYTIELELLCSTVLQVNVNLANFRLQFIICLLSDWFCMALCLKTTDKLKSHDLYHSVENDMKFKRQAFTVWPAL